MFKFAVSILASFFLLIPVVSTQIFAGGGSVRLEPSTMTSSIGRPISVRAYLTDESALSSPQNIQIKIRNQWPSANCTMDTTVVNAQGYVSAVCSTTTDGMMEIYGVWVEKGDESQSMFLEFKKEQVSTDPAEPIATVKPATKPTQKPTSIPSPTPTQPNQVEPFDQVASPATGVIELTPNPQDRHILVNKFDPRLIVAVTSLFLGLLLLLGAGGIYLRTRRRTNLLVGVAIGGIFLMAIGGVSASTFSGMRTDKIEQSIESFTTTSPSPEIVVVEPSPLVTPTPVPPPITDIKITFSGEVIHDQNCDYKKNPGEPGLSGIEVPISTFGTASDRTIGYVTTNDQGKFSYITTIKSNQQLTLQARVEISGYGLNNFPEMPGAITLSAKRPSVHQLHPLMKVGGDCDQVARY